MQTGHGDFRAAVARMDAGSRLLRITVLKDMSPEQRQINRLRLVFGTGVAAAAVCLLVLGWVFSVWAARPLEDARKMQGEFISAVSHELRSPLSVIRMNAENMEKTTGEKSFELSLRFAGKIVKECSRFSRLIDDTPFGKGRRSHLGHVLSAGDTGHHSTRCYRELRTGCR